MASKARRFLTPAMISTQRRFKIHYEFSPMTQNQPHVHSKRMSTMRLIRTALIASILAFSSAASAFTPENGTWWNPAEPGSGYLIEIQDNFLFLAGYMYAPDGRPTFYTAQGTMNGNARFLGELSTFSNGQCLGCVWRQPSVQLGAGGPIEIIFDTETAARMTLGGRQVPIQRFDYALTRTPGDVKTDMMLGEWQLTIDFSASSTVGFPFYGDVLVYQTVDRAPSPDIFDGCRAGNSLDGRCSQAAIANHDSSGFYQASSGNHYLIVNDDRDNFAYYIVKTGTYQFDGIVKICPKSLSNVTTQCLQSNNYRSFPVRGHRTASRTFVLSGSGPNEPAKSDQQSTEWSLARMVGDTRSNEGMDNAAVKSRFNIDLGQAPVKELEELTARMLR